MHETDEAASFMLERHLFRFNGFWREKKNGKGFLSGIFQSSISSRHGNMLKFHSRVEGCELLKVTSDSKGYSLQAERIMLFTQSLLK